MENAEAQRRTQPVKSFRSADSFRSALGMKASYEIHADSLLPGAGVAVLWNERTATYVYYDGELGRSNYQSNNVSGNVRREF